MASGIYVKPSELRAGDRIITNFDDVEVRAVKHFTENGVLRAVHVRLSDVLVGMLLGVSPGTGSSRGTLTYEGADLTDASGYDIYIRPRK